MAIQIDAQTLTNISSYPNTFQRGGAFPIDQSTLFSTLSEAQTYAATDGKAYVGQPLTVAIPGSEWTFSDEGEHTLIWDAGAWSFDQSDTGNEDYFATSITINSGESNEITAIRTTAPSVKFYIIGADGTLIEMGTKAEIDDASGDASGAIAALDTASDLPTASVSDGIVTIKTIKQVDGLISNGTDTDITLAKVATTGLAEDVTHKKYVTATAGQIIKSGVDYFYWSGPDSEWKEYTGSNPEFDLNYLGEVVESITDGSTTNPVTHKESETVQAAIDRIDDTVTSNAVTMTTNGSPSETGVLKTYTFWAGGTTSDNVNVGGTEIGTIKIPKDFLVKGARLVQAGSSADEATTPPTVVISGATVGSRYIEFTINTKDSDSGTNESKFYIAVEELFDSYTSDDTSSTAIQITVDNTTNKISATCNISSSATIATVVDGVVTLKAGLTQSSGVVTNDSGTDITLAKVATTGAAGDVDIADSGNLITATTVEGALAEIATEINNMDLASTAVATKSGKAVTINAIKETDGVVAVDSTANTVTLADVASTGKAEDIAIDDAGSVVSATTVEGAIQEIATEIDGMDLASTAIATKSGNAITINAIKETDGVVAVDSTANTITLADVASTGSGDDVTYTTGVSGESVNDALTRLDGTDAVTGSVSQKIKTAIDALDVSSVTVASESNGVVTLTKAVSETDGKVSAINGANSTITLAKVATTGNANEVAYTKSVTATQDEIVKSGSNYYYWNISDEWSPYSGSNPESSENYLGEIVEIIHGTDNTNPVTLKLGSVSEALNNLSNGIDGLDADLNADNTGLTPGSTVSTVAVISGVTQVDGVITSVDSTLVDAAGSAAAVLGNSNNARTDTTVYGARALAAAKGEYLGTSTTLTYNSSTSKYDSAVLTIGGSSVTASKGDICTYNGVEYIWNGSEWKHFGIYSIVDSDNNSVATVDKDGVLKLDNLIIDGGSSTATIS